MKTWVDYVGISITLCLTILLAACQNPNSVPPLPTVTRTPIPTATPIPPTPTLTLTPSPTPTPAPLVTPPAEGIPAYTLDIMLNYADRRLDVTQQVLLHNSSPDVWEEVVFAVPPAHQPEVFTVTHAEVTTAWDQLSTHTTLSHTMLHVPLPVAVPPDAPVLIKLEFMLNIPTVGPTDWLPHGNLGAGERLIQAGDWHPTHVPYKSKQGWQTWNYYLVGDPNIYSIASYDVTLNTDAMTVIAAPGYVSQVAQMHHYHLDRARCFAFLASPEYYVLEDTAGAVPMHVYYLPEYAEAAQAVIDTVQQALPLYEEIYGPYPTADLVVAQNAYYGAMEYSGLISMSGYAYDAYTDHPLTPLVVLTVHELAHQWWYGAVGNDQVHEPWLDESFAKYSEVLFYQRYYPELTDRWWNTHVYNRDLSGPLDSSIYDFSSTPAYIDRVYAQGARFLADLRGLMGDPAFFAFTKAYRAYGDGRIVTQDDFFAAVRAHTNADLSDLMSRYFSP